MNMRGAVGLAFVPLVGSLACDGVRPQASVTLDLVAAGAADHAPPIQSGNHLVRVRHTLNLPADCKAIDGAIAAAAGQLTLRIGPKRSQEACGEQVIAIPYTATIDGLRPGRYNLRVVHSRRGAPARVVIEHPVVVAGPR